MLSSCSPGVRITAFPTLDGSIVSDQQASVSGVVSAGTSAGPALEATEQARRLVDALQLRAGEFEDLCELGRAHLEQSVQLGQFELDAKQVISWMRNGESMLTASFVIPTCFPEAEELQVEHEQFQLALEVSAAISQTITDLDEHIAAGLLSMAIFGDHLIQFISGCAPASKICKCNPRVAARIILIALTFIFFFVLSLFSLLWRQLPSYYLFSGLPDSRSVGKCGIHVLGVC